MSRIKKFLYVLAGLISVGLGALGAILPILPTTPFLLLALFCFARGSERWNKWFIGTKLYKRYLDNYVQNRAMTLKQKVMILLFADFMIAFPLVIINNLLVRLLLIAVISVKYYYFIFKIKTIKYNEEASSSSLRMAEKKKALVQLMIRLYCSKKHMQKDTLCRDCEVLLEYSHKRLSNCRFMDKRTSCRKCAVHCYNKNMRERIREVMRFSAPRLAVYRPSEFVRHIFM
jgi:uncharacterized protein